jgi:hypothetical protein
MAKDPRFNFYPDNWSGGTKRMNFEQKGAYMELLLLNFYCFSDGLQGFTESEAIKSLANATGYAELWNFLKPKFKTDGTHYWSERMQKEFYKAKKHSEKQTERANKRWKGETANAVALPVNGSGIGNGNGIVYEDKGVQGEKKQTPPPSTPKPETLADFEWWTEQVITGNDVEFINLVRNHSIGLNGQLERLARDHLALASRHGWHEKTKNQAGFRYSLLKHLKENLEDKQSQQPKKELTKEELKAARNGKG